MILEQILNSMSQRIDDPMNYLRLADFYMDTNPDQAYLSLENAMFWEKKIENKKEVQLMMKELQAEGAISVRPVSFVILSFHNLDYTKACIESIRMTCCQGSYEIVIVDNGSEAEVVEWLKEQNDIKLILNKDNVGFPAGCNQGIKAASDGNDIFLLNNDTVMLPNSLYCLRMALYSNPKIGSVGAMGSNVPNDQKEPGMNSMEICFEHAVHNNVPRPSLYEKRCWLLGFALLIRHDVQKEIGLLDERFTPGNYEDNDYCYRILEKGHQNILCHNSLIVHYGGKGFDTEKSEAQYRELCDTNLHKIRKKWGIDIDYYSYRRNELIRFIEQDHPDHNDSFRVLECDCGMGATLMRIQYLYPNAKIYGIELVQKVVELGMSSFDIVQGNIEHMMIRDIIGETVDYIIFGDVLEHLKDPYRMLIKCNELLKPDGKILVSLPNIMHISVIIPLLKGHFSFEKEGIRGYTHLHNFTHDNIREMFENCGYEVEKMPIVTMDREQFAEIGDRDIEWFNSLINDFEPGLKKQFEVYQYLVKARKKSI